MKAEGAYIWELAAIQLNMYQTLKLYFIGLNLMLVFTSYGQNNLTGTYVRRDTLLQHNNVVDETALTIKGDSIWFDRNKNLKGKNFFSYKGTIHKYKDFYNASLILMECDTCPAFWKYTTKSEDSTGVDTVWISDKVDTTVWNGDTSYMQGMMLDVHSEMIELRRILDFDFTISNSQDLFVDDKLYRRKLK